MHTRLFSLSLLLAILRAAPGFAADCSVSFAQLGERPPLHRSLPTRPFESMFGELGEVHFGQAKLRPAPDTKLRLSAEGSEEVVGISTSGGSAILSSPPLGPKGGRPTPWSLAMLSTKAPLSKNDLSGAFLKVRNASDDAKVTLTIKQGAQQAELQFDVAANAGNTRAQEISVPLQKLKFKNTGELAAPPEIKVEVKFAGKGGGKLEFVGPLTFQKDLRFSPWKEEALRLLSLDHGKAKHRRLLNIILKNLYDPEAQAHALKVVTNSSELKKFMARTATTMQKLKGKVKTSGHASDGTRPFFGGDTQLRRNAVPIESGAFGKEHGELSHLAQLIAITHGLNRKTEKEVVDLFGLIIRAGNVDSWRAWALIFEPVGNRLPTSPRFWRDKIEQNKRAAK